MPKSQTLKVAQAVKDVGFFVLRTPLLPIEDLTDWAGSMMRAGVEASEAGAATLEKAWREDATALRGWLRRFVERPEIRQALFVASPSFEASLRYWATDPDSKKGVQAERTLVRYFLRMCGRSTPFGVFSGCSFGPISSSEQGRETELRLAPRDQYRTASRLDFDYLFSLTAALRNDPAIAIRLRYWPNSSLRRIGDVWHYVESRVTAGKRSHHVVKLYNDATLEEVLDQARAGLRIDDLVQFLLKPQDGFIPPDFDEADAYVRELVRSQVLVSDLVPNVTGPPILDELLNQLEELPAADVRDTLQRAKSALEVLDGTPLGVETAAYANIAASLKPLPGKADLGKLFQVDMFKPFMRGALTDVVMDEVLTALDILCRVGQNREAPDMRAFKDAFVARYEHSWMPLDQVLDEDTGIGFAKGTGTGSSPLLKGIGLPGKPAKPEGPNLQAQVAAKLKAAAPSHQEAEMPAEIVLEVGDLPAPDAVLEGIQESFDLGVTLIADSMDAVRQGDFLVSVRGISGPPAARMLGRFCDLDQGIADGVRKLAEAERDYDPDAVYAEIVYLPEGRLGNVICRPLLRDYEITYLGRSGAPPDRQLPVSDLLVTVTPKGRIVLYSQRLRKRILPRLTNAHGYFNPMLPAVYRFLCSLQHEEVKGMPMFSFGALESQKTLPRVRVGKVLLANARWRLDADEVKQIQKKSRAESFGAVQLLRKRRNLPRWVLLVESDHTLPVDLDNPLSVDAFVSNLPSGSTAVLSEMNPAPGAFCVESPEGHFQHEIQIPFLRRTKTNRDAELAKIDAERDAKPAVHALRVQPPGGSEWLYVKIYAGSATLDDLLLTTLTPLVEAGAQKALVSEWFFLRYSDPETHLRVRFRTLPGEPAGRLMALVSGSLQGLVATGRVWKVQFDTYEREFGRYGGHLAIEHAEAIFCADSVAVHQIVRLLDGDSATDLRWQAALLGLDRMISDFGLNPQQSLEAAARLRDSFSKEFNADSGVHKQIGDRFRRERKQLQRLLEEPPADLGPTVAAMRRVFDKRSRDIAPAIAGLHLLEEAKKLETPLVEILGSLMHMQVNRLISASARAHELVLYDFLYRIYDARLARNAGNKAPEEAHEMAQEPTEEGIEAEAF